MNRLTRLGSPSLIICLGTTNAGLIQVYPTRLRTRLTSRCCLRSKWQRDVSANSTLNSQKTVRLNGATSHHPVVLHRQRIRHLACHAICQNLPQILVLAHRTVGVVIASRRFRKPPVEVSDEGGRVSIRCV